MSSRIEQIIDEIDEFIESCKFQPLSATKIIVNKEEIEELLRELRLKTPDEIKRYQKIISNKDAILEDAQSKADAIIADAQAKAQENSLHSMRSCRKHMLRLMIQLTQLINRHRKSLIPLHRMQTAFV